MILILSLLQRVITLLLVYPAETTAFSASGKGFGNNTPPPSAYVSPFDRFRSSCPADPAAIRRFDPTLIDEGDADDPNEDEIWVAVYRSRNNMPSVFARDDFVGAMEIATSGAGSPAATNPQTLVTAPEGARPVAVARLRVSSASPDDACVMDSMRCALKKESTDSECDGGSEHAEAIGVCIDELVLAYLRRWYGADFGIGEVGGGDDGSRSRRGRPFDGGIRFRGTLVSGKLLEERGFRPVDELSSDMHSHESDVDGAFEGYAKRSASKVVAKNPGASDRALRIVSEMAKIDREEDKNRRRKSGVSGDADGDGGDDFDPWASVKNNYT